MIKHATGISGERISTNKHKGNSMLHADGGKKAYLNFKETSEIFETRMSPGEKNSPFLLFRLNAHNLWRTT